MSEFVGFNVRSWVKMFLLNCVVDRVLMADNEMQLRSRINNEIERRIQTLSSSPHLSGPNMIT